MPNNPLKVAVNEVKSVKMVEFLVENGVFVDTIWQGVCRTFAGQRFEIRGLSSLSCALVRNDRIMVEKLVQLNANVNMKIPCYSFFNEKWHEYYTTPLLTSIEMSNAQIVNDILNFGANIKMVALTSSGGELDAITLAEQRQDFSIIKVLQTNLKKMWTLKELCRFCIRNQLSKQNSPDYDSLRMPNALIDFLQFL